MLICDSALFGSQVLLISCFLSHFVHLSDDKDLKVPIEDDAFLKKFLRPRKYYPESAYELVRMNNGVIILQTIYCFAICFKQLKSYHKMKTRKDFVMDNISTEAIKIALEERVVQLLPNRDSHGRRIIFLEMGGKFFINSILNLCPEHLRKPYFP